MAEGRQIDTWKHTSSMMAQVYNLNRPKGVRAVQPEEFHPYGRRRTPRQATAREIGSAICPGGDVVTVSASAFNNGK